MSESHSPPYQPDAEEREAARVKKMIATVSSFRKSAKEMREQGAQLMKLTMEEVSAILERLDMLNAYIREQQKRHQEARDALDRINSWER